jgi:hypothetical protein
LAGYSGIADWEVQVIAHSPQAAASAKSRAVEPAAQRKERKSSPQLPPGSMVALEEEAEKQRSQQVVGEAKNDPMVKAALSVFEGSTIEKVSVLKGEG